MNDTAGNILRAIRRSGLYIFNNNTAFLFTLFIILFVTAGFLSPSFLKPENLLNTVHIVSLTGIVAIGMTFILLVGEIDLSVGSIISLATVVGGRFIHLGTGYVLAITLATGLILGLFNGLVIVFGRIPSLIMTLGTLTIYQGLANIVSKGQSVYPYQLPVYLWISKGSILGVPIPIIIFVLIILFSSFLLHYTRFGRWVYFTGANRTASYYSGGATSYIVIVTFLISGLYSAMVGPLISGQINRIWSLEGFGYELSAIAIAVLGGTSLDGGNGNIVGTLLASLIFGCLINLLNLTGVGTYLQEVVKGLLLVVIVALIYLKEQKR